MSRFGPPLIVPRVATAPGGVNGSGWTFGDIAATRDLQNLTIIGLLKPNVLNKVVLLSKGSFNMAVGSGGWAFKRTGSTGAMIFARDRVTTAKSSVSNAGTFTAGEWQWWGVRDDNSAAFSDMYWSRLHSPLKIVGHTGDNAGVGANTSDSGQPISIGSQGTVTSSTTQIDGSIAFVSLFNRLLSLEEMHAVQLNPYVCHPSATLSPGEVRVSGCVFWSMPGQTEGFARDAVSGVTAADIGTVARGGTVYSTRNRFPRAVLGVSAVVPNVLAITQQPGNIVTGNAFSPVVTVEVRTNGTSVDTGQTGVVTATITTGGGTLVGTVTRNAVAGVATFTGLGVAGSGSHVITFSYAAYTSAASSAFSVFVPALAITQQPTSVVTGSAFSPVVTVEARTNGTSVDTGSSLSITAAILSGTGTLLGIVTRACVAGVATFTGLGINTGTGAFTLRFTASAYTQADSSSFTATVPGAIAHIAQQPTNINSGGTFSPTVTVEAWSNGSSLDSTFTGNCTVTVASGSGNILGVATVACVAGVATFNGLGVYGATGAHTLSFAISGYTSATSSSFTLASATYTVAMVREPICTLSGVACAPSVQVEVKVGAARDTAFTGYVVANKQTGTGSSSGSTLTVPCVAGLATFNNLIITGTLAHTWRFTKLSSGETIDSAAQMIRATPATEQLSPNYIPSSSYLTNYEITDSQYGLVHPYKMFLPQAWNRVTPLRVYVVESETAVAGVTPRTAVGTGVPIDAVKSTWNYLNLYMPIRGSTDTDKAAYCYAIGELVQRLEADGYPIDRTGRFFAGFSTSGIVGWGALKRHATIWAGAVVGDSAFSSPNLTGNGVGPPLYPFDGSLYDVNRVDTGVFNAFAAACKDIRFLFSCSYDQVNAGTPSRNLRDMTSLILALEAAGSPAFKLPDGLTFGAGGNAHTSGIVWTQPTSPAPANFYQIWDDPSMGHSGSSGVLTDSATLTKRKAWMDSVSRTQNSPAVFRRLIGNHVRQFYKRNL